MPLMKTFSRPEISGWKPAPSSMSAEMRPLHRHAARRRLRDARHHLQQRALARAVAADDAEGAPARDVERHALQRVERLVGIRSLTRVPDRIALLSVANCRRRRTCGRPSVTSVTSMAFIAMPVRIRGSGLGVRKPCPLSRAASRARARHTSSANVSLSRSNRSSRQEEPDRDRAEGDQPFPVPEGPGKNRISWYETARCVNGFRFRNVLPIGRRVLHRVDDRRREEPERHRFDRMSLRSRKCTVSADTISARPSVSTSCTSTTTGKPGELRQTGAARGSR